MNPVRNDCNSGKPFLSRNFCCMYQSNIISDHMKSIDTIKLLLCHNIIMFQIMHHILSKSIFFSMLLFEVMATYLF